MTELRSIIGSRVDRVIYQGNGTVSVLLTEEETGTRRSVNMLECFHYDDTGIGGLVVENVGISILGMNLSAAAEALGISRSAHKQLWIKVANAGERKRELMGGCASIDVADDVYKYDPVTQ